MEMFDIQTKTWVSKRASCHRDRERGRKPSHGLEGGFLVRDIDMRDMEP